MSTKTRRLKSMLTSKDAAVLMEAHNGLSAKLAQEAGFQALWGSGLSISAALGVRDNNEASWTQVLEVLEFMADATDLPILIDGDTGYGNFNNMRRLVTEARAARHRRRGHRGQAVPEDQLVHRRREADAGRDRRVLRQDQAGQGHASDDPDFVVMPAPRRSSPAGACARRSSAPPPTPTAAPTPSSCTASARTRTTSSSS
jgi:phosphoenolpyruvate phosphomutase